MREASVRLVLANLAATGVPEVLRRGVLKARLRPIVASDVLSHRVRILKHAINKAGGRRYWQPAVHSMTVVSWETVEQRRNRGTVVFLGYEEIQIPGHRRESLPVQRFSVTLRQEAPGISGWRLVDFREEWLSPEGPMAPGGTNGRTYSVRQVFRWPAGSA